MVQIRIRAVTPKKNPLDPQAYVKAEQEARMKSARRVRDQFKRTTRTWKRQPEFVVRTTPPVRGYIRIVAGTDDKIWGYIDKGTPTRYIYPRRKPFLRFRVPFGPKTTPGLLTSKSGLIGNQWVSAKRVKHRLKARGFSKIIARQERDRLKREIDTAFRNVARRAK